MTAIVLADVSGSMSYPVALNDPRRRVDSLKGILRRVLTEAPTTRVMAFHSYPELLPGVEPIRLELPEPSGSTALDLALIAVAGLDPKPAKLIIISDGQPDNEARALAAARALAPIEISTFYVGEDGNLRAIGFLRAMSLAGGRRGVSGVRSLAKSDTLKVELVQLIGGPKQ